MSQYSIQTHSGREFDFSRTYLNTIHPRDIAVSLSRICRFAGHCKKFYSVAQHSVRVSEQVPAPYALQGLLHDAAEAYTNDISTPFKAYLNSVAGSVLHEVETAVEKAVRNGLGLPEKFHSSVKLADLAEYYAELRDNMHKSKFVHVNQGKPSESVIHPVGEKAAYRMFVARWIHLDPRVTNCF